MRQSRASDEVIQAKGFREHPIDPGLGDHDGFQEGCMAGDQDDGDTGVRLPECGCQLKSAHAWHEEIQEDHVEWIPMEDGQGRRAIGRDSDREARLFQQVGHDGSDRGFIVHD
jgi:hypothetical protein